MDSRKLINTITNQHGDTFGLFELKDNDATPFVTWHINAWNLSTSMGHYFKTREQAEKDLIDRANRG